MNLIVIFLIILAVFGLLAMLSSGNPNHSGGGSRQKFGIVGLLIFLFGILGISNYFQNIN